MVSLVMSTYNGERFIEEQLDSIRRQTKQPDEVIIADDRSSDHTYEFVKSYIQKYELSTWKVYQNEKNCGWEKSFMQLIQQAQGDYIFLADQDDIWMPEKIEVMTGIMEKNPQILVLTSNYEPFYMTGAIDKARNTEKFKNDGSLQKIKFNCDFLYVRRPGCVYCIRQSFVKTAAPYWFEKYPHDALFWRMARIADGLYVYQKALIRFRRHNQNASAVEVTGRAKKLEDIEYYSRVMKQVMDFFKKTQNSLDSKRKRVLKRVNNYCIYRLKFLKNRDILSGIKLCAYLDCYYALKTYLADWFVVVFNREIKR